MADELSSLEQDVASLCLRENLHVEYKAILIIAAHIAQREASLREQLAQAQRIVKELTPEDIREMAWNRNALLEKELAQAQRELKEARK